MIRDQIDELFNKEMSRKEFLQHIGAGILIMFGVGGLLNALRQQQNPQAVRTMGYGSQAYGGAPRR